MEASPGLQGSEITLLMEEHVSIYKVCNGSARNATISRRNSMLPPCCILTPFPPILRCHAWQDGTILLRGLHWSSLPSPPCYFDKSIHSPSCLSSKHATAQISCLLDSCIATICLRVPDIVEPCKFVSQDAKSNRLIIF